MSSFLVYNIYMRKYFFIAMMALFISCNQAELSKTTATRTTTAAKTTTATTAATTTATAAAKKATV